MLEIQDNQFLILECETECIEMYQMKIFYYRNIAGIKPFRFSMTEKRSYLYYPDKNHMSLAEYGEKKLRVKDLLRILEQIRLILAESENNLLYIRNFSLRPDWIYIDQENEQIKVELIYIPLKENHNANLQEHYTSFIRFLAKLFNELNEMEYFYFFKRLEDEETKDYSIEALMKVLDQLTSKIILQ